MDFHEKIAAVFKEVAAVTDGDISEVPFEEFSAAFARLKERGEL